MYNWNCASWSGYHIKTNSKYLPLLESWNKHLWHLSLPKPPPLHRCIFLLHSTMFYTVALVNTSSEDEISLGMLEGENPKESKTPSFPSIRTDACLMGIHQLTGRWNAFWKERSISKKKVKAYFPFTTALPQLSQNKEVLFAWEQPYTTLPGSPLSLSVLLLCHPQPSRCLWTAKIPIALFVSG